MKWSFKSKRNPKEALADLSNPDISVRRSAYNELAKSSDEDTDQLIIESLAQYESLLPTVTLALIGIAGKRQINDAIPLLIDIFEIGNPEFRENIIEATGVIKTADAATFLLKIIGEDFDDNLKEKARETIKTEYGKDILPSILKLLSGSSEESLYYLELNLLMEEMNLFAYLKENFLNSDLMLKDFYFPFIRRFNRPDFIPLYINYYTEAEASQKDAILKAIFEYPSPDIITALEDSKEFHSSFSSLIPLIDELLEKHFPKGHKEAFLKFVSALPNKAYAAKTMSKLLEKADPYCFDFLFKQSMKQPEMAEKVFPVLENLVETTYKRIQNQNELTREDLATLYTNWENTVQNYMQDSKLSPEEVKYIRKLFFIFAKNNSELFRPFGFNLITKHFNETYQALKTWPFENQTKELSIIQKEEPAILSVLLTTITPHADENLWRLLLKLFSNVTDKEDKTAFIKNFLDRFSGMSFEHHFKDKDPDIRASALELAVAESRNPSDLLTNALEDPEGNLRLQALKLFKQKRLPNAEKRFRQALKDPDEKVAFFALTNTTFTPDDTELAKVLASFLHSSDPLIREYATEKFADLAQQRFRKTYADMPPETRKIAGQALQKLDGGFTKDLTEELTSSDPQVRLQAAILLEHLRISGETKKVLVQAMKDPSNLVRSAVVRTIGAIGDKEAIYSLTECLRDPDARVRANTVETIANLGEENVVHMLLPFADDKDNRVRGNALVGLKQYGNRDIVPAVSIMLTDSNEKMRATALWVIKVTNLNIFLPQTTAMLFDSSELVRLNAIKTIMELNPILLNQYIPSLRKDPSSAVKELLIELSKKLPF